MKKFLSICLFFVMFMSMVFVVPVETFADSASASASSSVVEGSEVTVTFSVSSGPITSGSISISFSSDFEFVSGKWVVSGTSLSNFDSGSRKGVMAFSGEKSLSGSFFQVTLRAKNVSPAASVTASIQLKNGAETTFSKSVTKSIKIVCKYHKFGEWTQKDPTCTAAGSRSRVCSVCSTEETETLAAKGHELTDVKTTKEPTCTDKGEEAGKCKVCGENVTRSIAAKGHTFGSWMSGVASTCTEHGTETRTCMDCGEEEKREAELAPHVFSDDVEILREATLSFPGLARSKCVNCGKEVEQELPCGFKDADTGIEISCEEGAFRPGTEVIISPVVPEEDEKGKLMPVVPEMKDITDDYSVFDFYGYIDGNQTASESYFELLIPIPEGYGDNVALAVLIDGEIRFVSASRSADGKYLVAHTNEFGRYIVCNFGEYQEPVNVWKYVAAGEGVLCLLLLVIILLRKKKNK